MIKQVNVVFEYDPEMDLVSNIKCFIDGVEKKKTTTTRKATRKDVVLEDESIITLEENKISFNNKAASEMGLTPDSRIIIKYKTEKDILFPIIGTDISFDEEGSGNKLTKSLTVACRGKANAILSEHGTKFYITYYEDGIWKLVSKDKDPVKTYETIIDQVEKQDFTVFTEDDQNLEISEMMFKI